MKLIDEGIYLCENMEKITNIILEGLKNKFKNIKVNNLDSESREIAFKDREEFSYLVCIDKINILDFDEMNNEDAILEVEESILP